jgi:hypothetical protein
MRMNLYIIYGWGMTKAGIFELDHIKLARVKD